MNADCQDFKSITHHERLQFSPFQENEVHVWRISLSAWKTYEQQAINVLVEEERSRADRFCFHADFSRFVVTRALLRCILGRLYLKKGPRDLVFHTGQRGKLFLKDTSSPPFFFNVSHSGVWSLIAVAQRHVGVDIERIRQDMNWEQLVQHVFSPQEQQALNHVAPERRQLCFFTTWTRKEAYLKARGDGLFISPHDFSLPVDPEKPARLLDVSFDHPETSRWTICDIHVGPDYAAAVVARKPDWTLRVIDTDPQAVVSLLT